MIRKLILASVLALGLSGSPAVAGGEGLDGYPEALADEPSVVRQIFAMEAYQAGMDRIDYTGDADFDFVLRTIPHLQAVIDFAEIVVEFGSDPELRALAETMIDTWQPELERLQIWLAARGPE